MLEHAEARDSMTASQLHTGHLQIGGQRLEAAQLFRIEVRILRERHHGPRDLDRLSPGKIADEGAGLSVRHADPSDTRVDAYVDRDRPAKASGREIELVADRRVDHGHD